MKRSHIAALLVLIVAVPAAAGSFFSSSGGDAPCFRAGNTGYRLSSSGTDLIVRIDNKAAHPDLRMQAVDDPAEADFVLVDDGEAGNVCAGAASIRSVRHDGTAKPDLTVALSRQNATENATAGNADTYKIYVHSARFSAEDAATVFAAMWRTDHPGGFRNTVAVRD